VDNVEHTRIDKQGRLVIPASVRKALGISGESEVLVRVDNGRIIIEPISRDIEASVNRWIELAMRVNPKPFMEEAEGSWKWVSYEYAKRKLGIPRRST